MSIEGTWNVRMRTPIGTLEAVFVFTEIEGVLSGEAVSDADRAEMRDVVAVRGPHSEVVRWDQTITKPMRLHLKFEVEVDGDTFQGFSKAGRLPRSRVDGIRRAAPDPAGI